jgi:hypothetical protein
MATDTFLIIEYFGSSTFKDVCFENFRIDWLPFLNYGKAYLIQRVPPLTEIPQ